MVVSGDMPVSGLDGAYSCTGTGSGQAVFSTEGSGGNKDAQRFLLLVLSDPSAGALGNIQMDLPGLK